MLLWPGSAADTAAGQLQAFVSRVLGVCVCVSMGLACFLVMNQPLSCSPSTTNMSAFVTLASCCSLALLSCLLILLHSCSSCASGWFTLLLLLLLPLSISLPTPPASVLL